MSGAFKVTLTSFLAVKKGEEVENVGWEEAHGTRRTVVSPINLLTSDR